MRKLHFFSTLVALFFATTSLWAVPTGALPGAFTINSDCDMVYFSQGNLQYTKSTNTWSFMEQQYSTVETYNQKVGNDYANQDVVSLFGWGTSGWIGAGSPARVAYQPFATSNTNANYGVVSPRASSETLTGDYANGDWGVYNSSDLGAGWRTLTMQEWRYLLDNREGNRYAKATVHSVTGLIILPNGWTQEGSSMSNDLSGINKANAAFTAISDDDWTKLEGEGAVFLPAAGYRDGTTVTGVVGSMGVYWSSSATSDVYASRLYFYSDNVIPQISYNRYFGYSVRLVQNVPAAEAEELRPKASVATPPTAASNLIYNGYSQYLLTAAAGAATGGTVYYRLGTTGIWQTSYNHSSIRATDAGTYTVQWYVAHSGCYKDSEVESIEVTIAQADYTPSGSYSISGNNLSYTGSSQALVSVTGSVTDGTIWYKLGDGDWTTEIPTAATLGDYHVWYKVVPTNSNYKDTEPVEVLASITIPTVTDNSDASTINAVLALNPTDLMVQRTIYADGEYNTICLPFAVSASELTTSTHPLYGYERLKAFKGASVSGSGQDLSIDIFVEDVTEMEAGKPYLISYPSANENIVNPLFTGITVTTTEPDNVTADGVTFQGMFAQVHIDPYTSSAREQDFLFLGANSQLNWPRASETDESVKMRGFRAYFIIDRNAIPAHVAPRGTHARFVNAPKQPTSIENTELNTQAQKLLENGQLIILKNGIKYNAQGQVLK